MKKVVSVNLNGNAYQLEEDGFDALGRYLDGARLSLEGNPDLEEIVSDLEQSIADKMNRFLGRNKTVVSTAEIDEIVRVMGPVDAGTDADTGIAAGADGGATAAGPKPSARDRDADRVDEPVYRKLYRLTGDDENMLMGVCAGLSAYFGLDVTIIRIVFVALIFATSGLAILAYFLLAIVIPAAKTPEQIAQAYGAPFDAQDVIDRARSKFDDVRNDRRWRSQRRTPVRSTGSDGIGSLLGLILVAFAILIGLYVASRIFFWLGHPMSIGPPRIGGMVRFGGVPWWMTVLMVVFAVYLIGWIFGDHRPDSESRVGTLLVRTMQVFLILFIIYLAYRTLPFVREPVDALLYMTAAPFR